MMLLFVFVQCKTPRQRRRTGERFQFAVSDAATAVATVAACAARAAKASCRADGHRAGLSATARFVPFIHIIYYSPLPHPFRLVF